MDSIISILKMTKWILRELKALKKKIKGYDNFFWLQI